ncbi:MAG TPA: alpha-ketoglutarate-dependent dioxygenase AlkB [Gemmatimonadales bacterium]
MKRERWKVKRGAPLPEGFEYQPDFISLADEQALLPEIEKLPFTEFQFHGFVGKRRTVSFGWQYDFTDATLRRADEIPAVLNFLRDAAAEFAGIGADQLQHALVTEYGPGASIGWHRDKAVFGDVIGISLLSPSRFRFRRKLGATWERASLTVDPRSAYLLRGPSRTEWEHSIPAVESLRYSITFRSLRKPR